MSFYRILISIIFLLNSSIAYAQMSFTAVLSSGDVIVTKWNNASHSGSGYDYFVSSDIISITINGNQADISRIPNRYLEFYWGNSGYSLTSNPPAAGTDITQYLDFMMGLYLDDNTFNYLNLNAFSMFSQVSACSNTLCGSTITVGDGVTVTALYYGDLTLYSAPTNLVATNSGNQVSISFTPPNNGAVITDYEYQVDGGNWTSAATTSSPIVISGLANGSVYSIKVRAVNGLTNGTASAAVTVSLGSAQSVFTQNEDVIREQVQSVALQSIRNGVQEASGFMSSARDRFIGGMRGDVSQSVLSGRNNIPFDIDGSTSVSTSSANINGNFFGQFGNFDGTYRRMTSGDFNLQRDENGNTTGALSGRIAWEYLTSDTAMLGWFVGAEYIQSDMTGTFTGDQTSFGASIGGYFVTELQDQLYLDGHLTVKQNEHDLQLTNGILDLDSIYHSTSVLSGLTLTGVTAIDENSELWPTFSINAARTDLGTIGFTGTAYGLTDSTLSMDGGLVSYADVSVAPKYRAAMDGQTLGNSLLVATVTPKAMCEYTELGNTTSRNCGTGLLLGLLGTTKDGNGTLELELGLDSIGGLTRHSVALNADLRY